MIRDEAIEIKLEDNGRMERKRERRCDISKWEA
jgi:hypothetical protein